MGTAELLHWPLQVIFIDAILAIPKNKAPNPRLVHTPKTLWICSKQNKGGNFPVETYFWVPDLLENILSMTRSLVRFMWTMGIAEIPSCRRITYPFPSPAVMIFVDFPFGGICHIIPFGAVHPSSMAFRIFCGIIHTNQPTWFQNKNNPKVSYPKYNVFWASYIQNHPTWSQQKNNTPHPLKAKDFWTTIAAFVQQYEHPPCKKWRVLRECNLNMNPTKLERFNQASL